MNKTKIVKTSVKELTEQIDQLVSTTYTSVYRAWSVNEDSGYIHVVRLDNDFMTSTILEHIPERFPVELIAVGGKDSYPESKIYALFKVREGYLSQ